MTTRGRLLDKAFGRRTAPEPPVRPPDVPEAPERHPRLPTTSYGQIDPTEFWKKAGYYASKGLEYLLIPATISGITFKEYGKKLEPYPLQKPFESGKQYKKRIEELGLEPMREALAKAAIPLEEINTLLPGGKLYEEYQEEDWVKQLGYEAPFWGAMAILPGATAVRGALAPVVARGGVVGAAAEVASIGLAPIAGFEWVAGKTLYYLFGKPIGLAATRIGEARTASAWKKTPFYEGMKPEFRGTDIEKDFFEAFKLWRKSTPETRKAAEGVVDNIFKNYQTGRYAQKPPAAPVRPTAEVPSRLLAAPTAPPTAPVTPAVAGVPPQLPTRPSGVSEVPARLPVAPKAKPAVPEEVEDILNAVKRELVTGRNYGELVYHGGTGGIKGNINKGDAIPDLREAMRYARQKGSVYVIRRTDWEAAVGTAEGVSPLLEIPIEALRTKFPPPFELAHEWDEIPIVDRTELARMAKLEDKVGAKNWGDVKLKEREALLNALRDREVVITPAVAGVPPQLPTRPPGVSEVPARLPVAPKAKPAVPVAKEPWQMTDLNELKRAMDAGEIPAEQVTLKQNLDFSRSKGIKYEGLERIKQAHRNEITKALSEGKPVPPEVLKDYPDLKAPVTPEVTAIGEFLVDVPPLGVNEILLESSFNVINQAMSRLFGEGKLTVSRSEFWAKFDELNESADKLKQGSPEYLAVKQEIGKMKVHIERENISRKPEAFVPPVEKSPVMEDVGAVEPVIKEQPTFPVLPPKLPSKSPPISPEGEILGRTPNDWEGFMADLQSAETVNDIAFRDDYIRRWINLLPETHGLFRILNPSAVANTPAEKSIIVRAVLRDEAVQKTQGVMSYLSELGEQTKVLGKLNDKGEIAAGKFKGLTVGDIAHNFQKYVGQMTEKEKLWFERASYIENAVAEFFVRNGIDIELLALEEGGHFATRKVWAKVVEGEVLDVRYVGAGPGRPGSKIATEKRRWFKTEAEAIKQGYRYLPYDQSLYLKVQGAYNRVADKQMTDWLLTQVPWRTTGAPEELILAAEAATLKKRHSQLLLSALNRAVRGERVPDATINSIARSYPDQAKELKELIPKIQRGEVTADRVKNLDNVAKGLIKTNTGEVQRAINARARAREEALRVKYEEAVIPAPAFAGKILTGVEAKETARVLRKAFDPGFSRVLASVNKANDMVRFMILAGDASAFGIQLIFLPGAHPIVAAKAMRGYIGAFFSPEFLASYKFKHKATIDKHPNMMLPEAGTVEMTETMARGGWLSGKQTLLPQSESYWKNLALVIPRVFGKGAGYVLYPFARAYACALTVAGVEMAEALEYMGTTAARMADVDQHVNVFRGITSSARIGVTPFEQQAEKVAFLAPMYNRGIAALLFDAGRGGIRGAQARKGLAKGISALIAMGILLSLARGETPEEILDHFKPLSSNFLTWDVAGQKIGPGSKVRSVVKLFAQSADNPESLFQLAMDNPAFRFVRGNISPVVSTGYDLITGRNYIGDPTRDGMLSFSKEIIARNLLPIWIQSVLLEGGDLKGRTIRGIAEFFGGRAYPEPIWDEVGEIRDNYAKMDFNVKYEELNRGQINDLKRNHPDLIDLEEKARVESAERGTEREIWFDETRRQITEQRDTSLENAAYQLQNGVITKKQYDSERGYARPYYSGGMSVLYQTRDSLDPYSKRQIEKWLAESQKPEDKALDQYQEYRANLIQLSELPRDWDKIEAKSQGFLNKYPKQIREYIEANKNRWIETLPPNAQAVERMRARGIEDGTWWNNYSGLAKGTSKGRLLEKAFSRSTSEKTGSTKSKLLEKAFGR